MIMMENKNRPDFSLFVSYKIWNGSSSVYDSLVSPRKRLHIFFVWYDVIAYFVNFQHRFI